MKVALLGMGCSAEQYMRHCARHGSKDLFDQLWTVNSYGSIFGADLTWHMDDVRIQEERVKAGAEDGPWLKEMMRWFGEHPEQLVVTSRGHPSYPNLIEYPLEFVLNATGGPCYFNSTPSYALGLVYASHTEGCPLVPEPIDTLAIFGCDFAYAPGIWKGEKGRACMEYWLGRIQEQGKTQIKLPKETWLMDVNCLKPYGYDTVFPKITDADGRCEVIFEELPREKWPTAEQIEERYAKR